MKLAKSTLSAVAAAIAAAAVLTTVAVPAQAGYKRAKNGNGVIKALPVKPLMKKRLRMMWYKLPCVRTSGDVVAQWVVINNTGKILPVGAKITWRMDYKGASFAKGTHTLTKQLPPGQIVPVYKKLPWNLVYCWARVKFPEYI